MFKMRRRLKIGELIHKKRWKCERRRRGGGARNRDKPKRGTAIKKG